jgi:ribonucleoside-diphosphate reductase alpha chain
LREWHKDLGLDIKQSNLCSEIMLPTGEDATGSRRSSVCCLSSVNAAKWDEWKDNPLFIQDLIEMLDNVLSIFIQKTEGLKGFEAARYSAMNSRDVGLGMMGWHTLLQSKMIPWESFMANGLNNQIWKHVRSKAEDANAYLTVIRGKCPDSEGYEDGKRLSYMLAIAPTATNAVMCGNVSPSIEPIVVNAYTHSTQSGDFVIINPELKKLFKRKNIHLTDSIVNSIILNEGSVQHLDCLTQDEKDVFKTAFEINQLAIVEQAANRQKYIDQGQSLNLFFKAAASKEYFHSVHYYAWLSGLKGLYYCRSTRVKPGETISTPKKAAELADIAEQSVSSCFYCEG